MKQPMRALGSILALVCLTLFCPAQEAPQAHQPRLHAIFDSDMVLQRGKPIVIWGWAKPGDAVSVQLGKDKAEAKAAADKGLTRKFGNQWKADGETRLNYRRTEEAKRALEIIQRVPTLGKPKS
jgi:Skp family chaperone for outer membrane proteins